MPAWISNLFETIKREHTIMEIVEMLDIKMKREGDAFRSHCPRCKGKDPRALVVTPAEEVFYCHSSEQGGDLIALVAHIAGVRQRDAAHMIRDHFGHVPDRLERSGTAPITATVPEKKTEGGTNRPSQSEAVFDPDRFAASLIFNEEVEKLGISEQDACRLTIGYHPRRKKVYFPMRNPDGSYSGFITFAGEVKLPPQWISSNVVPLKRRA